MVSPMPGPPPRQHKHERQYTRSTHPVIPIRRRWNDDDDGQMIFGDLVGLKCPTFVLQVRKNPEKTSPRKLVPTGDRTWARCVTGAHATTCSTAVDKKGISNLKKFYKYLKNFLIFFLNIAMCSEIVFSLCKNTTVV